MKSDLGDLFAMFPDLPRSFRQPIAGRVMDVRMRADEARRRIEGTVRARKARMQRAQEMRKRRNAR